MNLLADVLLVIGALGLAGYCHILSRRLKNLKDLDKGVGGAISVLSAQVEDLKSSINDAKHTAESSSQELLEISSQAKKMSDRIELQLASMHDIPTDRGGESSKESSHQKTTIEPFFVRHKV